jgi:hypothetical protein
MKTTRDGTCAIAIDRQCNDCRLYFWFPRVISVFGTEGFSGACGVLAEVTLFVIVRTVFYYVGAPAGRTFQSYQSHCSHP